MVGERDLFEAAEDGELPRAYAERLASMASASAFELGALRHRFVAARDGVRGSSAATAPDLGSAEGCFHAFVNGTASRRALETAAAALPVDEPAAKRLRDLLPHHAAWMRARFDRRVPRGILKDVAKAMSPRVTPPPLHAEVGKRREALHARRLHPVLVTLAPAYFASLLTPDYRKAAPAAPPAPKPARVRISERKSSGPARRRRSRIAQQSEGGTNWIPILVALLALGGLRFCRAQRQPPVELPSPYERTLEREEYQRRLEEFRRDIRDMRGIGSEGASDDDEPFRPGRPPVPRERPR